MVFQMENVGVVCSIIFAIIGLSSARSGLYSEESLSSIRIEQCHNECIKKFATDDMSCLQAPECSMCWDDCTASTTINKSILPTWSLGVTSMVRDNSLVSTTISWDLSRSPSDCLVTWEVSGGGLIGNLLTQSSNVELSLWPETKYRIQVTCKNKQTEEISRSLPLTIDTNDAIYMIHGPSESNQSDDINQIDAGHDSYYHLRLDQTFMSTLATSSFLVWSAYESNKEYVLGSCAAVIVFIAILLTYTVSKRKSRTMDKAPLVDNEVSVNVDVERLTIHV